MINNIINFNGEEWKKIDGYDNYLISNYGRIINTKYKDPKILKPQKDKDGYYRITLWKNSKRKVYRVSRLVATMFVDNDDPENKTMVQFIDGDKTNYYYLNLQWVSITDSSKSYYKK